MNLPPQHSSHPTRQCEVLQNRELDDVSARDCSFSLSSTKWRGGSGRGGTFLGSLLQFQFLRRLRPRSYASKCAFLSPAVPSRFSFFWRRALVQLSIAAVCLAALDLS